MTIGKIENKKEIYRQRQQELEKIKQEIRNDIAEVRTNKANELIDKYRDKLIEIASYRKKQEELIEEIYKENYGKHKGLCELCMNGTFNDWDTVFDEMCPLAVICGREEGYDSIIDNYYDGENDLTAILKERFYTKENIVVLDGEEND